ncbi:BIIDXI-like protein [Drosera capensis]
MFGMSRRSTICSVTTLFLLTTFLTAQRMVAENVFIQDVAALSSYAEIDSIFICPSVCLLINGNFEMAPSGGFSDDVLGEGGSTIPGWASNGTVELVSAGQKQGAMILIIPGGSHAVRLGNDAEIGQDLKVEKSSLYSVTFSAARTCAQLESLNVSVAPATSAIDLQTVYSDQGWDSYAWAFEAQQDDVRLVLKNPGMEDDPTCGPVIDDIAIKKMFTPDRAKDNAVVNGDLEEGPWLFKNESLGVLLPTNLDQGTSPLPGWIVESTRAVRFIDSTHFSVPQGKRAVELVSGKEGIISQMVQTTPQKQYTLSFSMGLAGDSCKEPLAVMAFAGDQARNVHYVVDSNSTFQRTGLNFTAKSERTRIAFYSVYYNTRTDHISSLCGPVLDDVRIWATSGFAPITIEFWGLWIVLILLWVLV